MVATSGPDSDTLATLHIISHLDWEREGIETFEIQRARLLNTLTRLTNAMSSTAEGEAILKHFMLGGQTVILEDVNAVRPDLVALLSIYNAGGKLAVGPWYVQVDGMMVSGESLIRNLLLGRTDSKQQGTKPMPVAYMPDICEHTAQLPQILQSFDIDSAFLCHERTMMPLPFRWEALDGSSVLVMNYQQADSTAEAIQQQQEGQPDGPFLWMNRIDLHENEIMPAINIQDGFPVLQSKLQDYAVSLREGLPDAMRPTLKGELKLHQTGRRSGRFSARINLKQSNARLQTHLTYAAEPWLALALTHGKVAFPDNIRALLDYAWRLLIQNQARSTLGGFTIDTVSEETEIRSHKLSDVSVRIIDAALEALPGTAGWREQFAVIEDAVEEETLPETGPLVPAPVLSSEHTTIVVWNPHCWEVAQVVELPLRLPEGMNPDSLQTPASEEIPYTWLPADKNADHAGRLSFRAVVPPVGYASYTLSLTKDSVLQRNLVRSITGKVMRNSQGETITAEKGHIHWTRENQRIENLLNYYDGGDAGDVAEYRQPKPDVIVRASMTDEVKIESSPTFERMLLRHRMRITPQLRPGGGRERGLKLLDLSTTLTFYDNIPGLYIRTNFINDAQDHRLRAHINTGLKHANISADVSFGLVKRNSQTEKQTQPMQRICVASSMGRTLGLISRGLMEYEAINDADSTILALTLLRSIGWLDRDERIPASGAQLQRPIVGDFALMPLPPNDPAMALQAAQTYSAPLQAYQYQEAPEPARRSYLSLDNRHILMTALKPPQQGKGWIVRLLNPTDQLQTATIETHGRLEAARLVSMAEQDLAEYELVEGKFKIKIEPHKIHTLRLLFE